MREKKICLIDYGSGNVRSVFNMVESTGVNVKISSAVADLDDATHLILPGVGAFGAAMEKLRSLNIVDALCRNVLGQGKPFLGICVGMQILANCGHEHGINKGLGWIPGEVTRMEVGDLPLPHVGWNNLEITHKCGLVGNIGDEVDFYFTHSYSFCAQNQAHISAVFEYGGRFAAIVCKDNIFGVQFHPEKSQKAGKILLKNFFEYYEEKKINPSLAS